MDTKRCSFGRLGRAAGLAGGLLFCGWTVPKAGPAWAAQEGTILEYKMPVGQVLRYLGTSEAREAGEVQGQMLETVTAGTYAYSFRAKGRQQQNYLLEVTIDDRTLNVSTPRGDTSPDLASVKGRSFDMVLSPLGVEVDVSAAESITFELVTGPRSVASAFKLFFPDLPGKPVKLGDSWPSSFFVDEKAGEINIRSDIQSVNTLDGFETVDGLACARITSKLSGTISGSGSRQGLDLLFGGTLKGTDVWFFAPKEGIFVKSASDSVTEMTVSIAGAQSMTIASTQTQKGEVMLAGR